MKCIKHFSVLTLDKCSQDDEYVCKNGGTCHVMNSGDVSCVCSANYDGKTCEIGKYILYSYYFCKKNIILK